MRTVTKKDEICVTAAGSLSPKIAYAAKVLAELSEPTIVIKGTGNSLSKVVTAAEIVTRRFKGLRQVVNLDDIEFVNKREPLEEGLDKIVEKRNTPTSRFGRGSSGRCQLPGWCRRPSPRAPSARPAPAASPRSWIPPSPVSFKHGSAARPSVAGASRWLSYRLFRPSSECAPSAARPAALQEAVPASLRVPADPVRASENNERWRQPYEDIERM